MPSRSDNQFVDRLEQHRLSLGLGHVGFAKYLGVSHPYWSLIRRGLKPAADGFVGRVLTAHPELAALLEKEGVQAA